MKTTTNYVGIDISKLTFDVAIEKENGKYAHYKLSNDSKGFKEFLKLINKQSDCCVMEASGPYYLKLATFLDQKQVAVSVVNPLVIRRFSQMRMMRAKTDKKDALMIAQYGKTQTPKQWQPEEPYVLELKQMMAYVEQLKKNKSGLIRQQEAFKQNPKQSNFLNSSLKQLVNNLEKEIIKIETVMQKITKEHHQELSGQLQSIPGIGKKTSMHLIVLSGGFTKFENAKQLTSYVGLSPRIFESGTSVKGKAKICKMGMSRIRSMLYVCAWTARKYNKACRELYDRLLEKGKAKNLALIAVANKLLKQAFALATKKEYYLENNVI